jgi:hypothetical protein
MARKKRFRVKYEITIKFYCKKKPRKVDVLNMCFDGLRDDNIKYEVKLSDWKDNYKWKGNLR